MILGQTRGVGGNIRIVLALSTDPWYIVTRCKRSQTSVGLPNLGSASFKEFQRLPRAKPIRLELHLIYACDQSQTPINRFATGSLFL